MNMDIDIDIDTDIDVDIGVEYRCRYRHEYRCRYRYRRIRKRVHRVLMVWGCLDLGLYGARKRGGGVTRSAGLKDWCHIT